jgi:hypothetical protein
MVDAMSDSRAAEAIRRLVNGWRAAELREIQERRATPALDPEASLRAAVELCDLLPSGTVEEDAVRTREVAHARRAWAKLRARMSCQPIAQAR